VPIFWINSFQEVNMNISEWVKELEPDEQGYARQCFRFWNGSNGHVDPDIPDGMSKSKALVLKFHTKSLTDEAKKKRKLEELRVVSFRAPEKFEKELAFESAQIDVNKSIYIRACIEAGRPLVKHNPGIIAYLSGSVIPP